MDTLAMVKEKFTVMEEGRTDMEGIPKGFREFIVFEGPQGKIKLERTTTPVVLDRKTLYNARAGVAGRVEYIYSDTEMTHKFRAFRWGSSSGNWEELGAGSFS